MSIDALRDSFRWGREASAALRRAERAVQAFCEPDAAFRGPRQGLEFSLLDGRPRSLADVVDEASAALCLSSHFVRHPAATAHMVPPPATVAVIGDFLKAAANQCSFTTEQAPLAPAVEAAVLAWIVAMLEMPETSGGLMTSGGTISNYTAALLALERARDQAPREANFCAVATDQAHFSVAKALRLLGLPEEALFVVPTGPDGRVEAEAVAGTARRARFSGYRPFLFVCTAGTTNAGVLEPAASFANEAANSDSWLHIDGAHGAFLALGSHPARDYWSRADSVSWDPHKTLFSTYPAGALILRQPDLLKALAYRPSYAFQGRDLRHPALGHLEGSRGFEALKVWMTIRHFGREGFRVLVDHLLDLARHLAACIEGDGSLELITEPDTNIVCFRWVDGPPSALDDLNSELQRCLYDDGRHLLSKTRIGGRVVLRAVLQNPLTTTNDIVALVDAVRTCARTVGTSYADVAPAPGLARRVCS